jgi:hypothetical protein
MRRGVCSLRLWTARYDALTPPLNNVWWIARQRTDSALKTPHTMPPRHQFGGVSQKVAVPNPFHAQP